MEMNVDKLREHYLSMGPYPFDEGARSLFSDKEIDVVRTYGNWFQAIWRNQVPLVTPKLKHFYESRAKGFKGRTRVEDIWFRYKEAEVPF